MTANHDSTTYESAEVFAIPSHFDFAFDSEFQLSDFFKALSEPVEECDSAYFPLRRAPLSPGGDVNAAESYSALPFDDDSLLTTDTPFSRELVEYAPAAAIAVQL
jgi:hypothetical protein